MNKKNKGFTIIELLIVIVIIGILVAITAVSYTGITNGANTADAQTKARAISQWAIACQAKTGSWPTIASGTLNCTDTTGMELPKNGATAVTIQATAPTSVAQQKTTFQFTTSGNNSTVGYWDSAKTPAGVSTITN